MVRGAPRCYLYLAIWLSNFLSRVYDRKLHWLGELEGVHDISSGEIYGAKAVLTRPIELPARPVTSANESL